LEGGTERERDASRPNRSVGIGSEFGDDERGPVLHQTTDKMHVTAEPVELGDDDRAGLVDLPGGLERGGELGPAVERVGTLAGLDLGEAMDDVEALLGGEVGDGLALGFEADAALALPRASMPRASGRALRLTPFRRVYVQSAAGDAGGAIGAAFAVWHRLGGK
jgi:hypothetical protein